MKLSTLALTATLAFTSMSVFSKEIVFKTVNNNLETQVCYTAATAGLEAAKALVAAYDLNFNTYSESVTCNGSSIRSFANTYSKTNAAAQQEKVALVAKDTNLESKLCLEAVINGEAAARAKFNIYDSVLCNSQKLSTFVRKFKDQDVELRTTED